MNTSQAITGTTSQNERTSVIRSLIGSAKSGIGDRVFFVVCALSGILIMAVIAGLILQLIINSQPTIAKFGLGFITSSVWDPVTEQFGAAPFIYGTVVSSVLGLVFALPLSLGIAIFLVEISGQKVRTILSFLVETLAAIPSIVYGLWGIIVMVPLLAKVIGGFLQNYYGDAYGDTVPFFYGPSILSSAVILAIMILPIVTSISRDVMLAIPMSQREAALALGSTKWEAIKIVVSNARWGILGAVILGLGRALGETMAVTMVIGNDPHINASVLQSSYSMASVIANELNEATSVMHNSALIEIGLVLLITTFVVNMLARLLVWSVTRKRFAGGRL